MLIYRRIPNTHDWKEHHVQPDTVEKTLELFRWLKKNYPQITWACLTYDDLINLRK